jgi:type III secretory pathway component EscV
LALAIVFTFVTVLVTVAIFIAILLSGSQNSDLQSTTLSISTTDTTRFGSNTTTAHHDETSTATIPVTTTLNSRTITTLNNQLTIDLIRRQLYDTQNKLSIVFGVSLADENNAYFTHLPQPNDEWVQVTWPQSGAVMDVRLNVDETSGAAVRYDVQWTVHKSIFQMCS